jgi:hypothetical protein
VCNGVRHTQKSVILYFQCLFELLSLIPHRVEHPGRPFPNYQVYLPNYKDGPGQSWRPKAQSYLRATLVATAESPAQESSSRSPSNYMYDPQDSPTHYRRETGFREVPPFTRLSSRLVAPNQYDASRVDVYPIGRSRSSAPYPEFQAPVTPDRVIHPPTNMDYYQPATAPGTPSEGRMRRPAYQDQIPVLLSPIEFSTPEARRAVDSDDDMNISPGFTSPGW